MREYYIRELEKAKFGKTLLEQVLAHGGISVETTDVIKQSIASLNDSIKFFAHKLDNYEG
jgi:hypothetical protein